jgi:hypothetical protein
MSKSTTGTITSRINIMRASDTRYRVLADAQLDAIRALILHSREVRDAR